MYHKFHTKVLFIAIFSVLVFSPVVSKAQTIPSQTERAQLVATINWLLAQIEVLQAQIDAQSEKTPYTYSSDDNYEIVNTFYYGKNFEAIYEVNRALDLVRRDKITGPRSLDVRVFNDKNSTLGGFVELPAGDEMWIIGLNRDDFERGNEMSENIYKVLMIHEYAHLVTFYMEDFVEDFEDTFWTAEDKRHARAIERLDDEEADEKLEDYYEAHKNDFVSDYATYSVDEGIAETFVSFVLEKKPVRGFKKEDAKVLSMYANSKLLQIRNELRQNLDLD